MDPHPTRTAATGEMKFAGEKTGLFINHDDALQYYGALHTVLKGRHDPISHAMVEQLMQLMLEADDDTIGAVQVMKPFPQCHITSAVIDPVVKT
jgi:hypothetical protein